MAAILDNAKNVYAAGPSNAPKEPDKAAIIRLFGLVEGVLGSAINGLLVGGAVVYQTRAALFANLARPDGSLGIVYGDSNPSYNGYYAKSGASGTGSWALTNLALPSTFAADLAAVITAQAATAAEVTTARNGAASLNARFQVVLDYIVEQDSVLGEQILDVAGEMHVRDAELGAQITTAAAQSVARDTELGGQISTASAQSVARDDVLGDQILDVAGEMEIRDAELGDQIATAAAQSVSRDDALTAAIAAEASARATAVSGEASARATAVSGEATARIAGDAAEAEARTTAIAAEATARAAAVSAEAAARGAADVELGAAINAEVTARGAAVAAEASARATAIAAGDAAERAELDSRVSTTETALFHGGILAFDGRIVFGIKNDSRKSIDNPHFLQVEAMVEDIDGRTSSGSTTEYYGGIASADGRALMAIRNDADLTVENPYIQKIAAAAFGGGSIRPTVAVYGNSLTDQALADIRTFTRGYVYWLWLLTGGRIDFRTDLDFGISGDTTTQMLSRLDAVAASDADIVIMISPATNDCPVESGISAAVSIENMERMRDAILAAGKTLIILAETPRGNSTYTSYRLDQAGELEHFFRIREWEFAQRGVAGVHVADAAFRLGDPASTYFDMLDGKSQDGIHYYAPGAYDVAMQLVPIVNTIVPPGSRLAVSNADVYSGVLPTGNLVGNGMLAGINGTLDGVTNAGVAAGWELTGASGVTVTPTKTVDASGRPAQQIALSGTPTSDVFIDFQRTVNAAYLTAGDIVEIVGGIEVEANNGAWLGIPLSAVIDYPTSTDVEVVAGSQSNNGGMPTAAWSGVIVSPRMTVSETPSAITFRARIVLKSTAAISLTIRLSALSLRKIKD